MFNDTRCHAGNYVVLHVLREEGGFWVLLVGCNYGSNVLCLRWDLCLDVVLIGSPLSRIWYGNDVVVVVIVIIGILLFATFRWIGIHVVVNVLLHFLLGGESTSAIGHRTTEWTITLENVQKSLERSSRRYGLKRVRLWPIIIDKFCKRLVENLQLPGEYADVDRELLSVWSLYHIAHICMAFHCKTTNSID